AEHADENEERADDQVSQSPRGAAPLTLFGLGDHSGRSRGRRPRADAIAQGEPGILWWALRPRRLDHSCGRRRRRGKGGRGGPGWGTRAKGLDLTVVGGRSGSERDIGPDHSEERTSADAGQFPEVLRGTHSSRERIAVRFDAVA